MSLSIKIKGTLTGLCAVDLEIEIPERGFAVLVSAIASDRNAGYQKSVADVLRELGDG